jgi:hypothetical protein
MKLLARVNRNYIYPHDQYAKEMSKNDVILCEHLFILSFGAWRGTVFALRNSK